MSQTLAIQFEFLGPPKLSSPSSPEWGEWPPAPDRVYQTLVATAAETNQDMSVLTALEFPPEILASSASCEKAPPRYVPENFRRSNTYHQGASRYLPTVHPQSSVVTYFWHNINHDNYKKIVDIVQNITHLGRASSLVHTRVVPADGLTPNWHPDINGDHILRVPTNGRLNQLQHAFNHNQRSPQSSLVSYSNSAVKYPQERWKDLMILRPPKGISGGQATLWAERVRGAVMSHLDPNILPIISGHNPDGTINHRHVAWTAIPNVGHQHADGTILGVGCWLPHDITDDECGQLWQALTKITVNYQPLVSDDNDLKSLRYRTWDKPSHYWATVTPIALDRWPKKNHSAERIIADSIKRLGLPEPLSIHCSSISVFNGAASSSRYETRKCNRQLVHAVIQWNELIAGPLLIGAERYFGGGLCRSFKN